MVSERGERCSIARTVVNVNTPKQEVKALLDNLPDDCSLEDVQYHLYVIEKINRGIDRAAKESALGQD